MALPEAFPQLTWAVHMPSDMDNDGLGQNCSPQMVTTATHNNDRTKYKTSVTCFAPVAVFCKTHLKYLCPNITMENISITSVKEIMMLQVSVAFHGIKKPSKKSPKAQKTPPPKLSPAPAPSRLPSWPNEGTERHCASSSDPSSRRLRPAPAWIRRKPLGNHGWGVQHAPIMA